MGVAEVQASGPAGKEDPGNQATTHKASGILTHSSFILCERIIHTEQGWMSDITPLLRLHIWYCIACT